MKRKSGVYTSRLDVTDKHGPREVMKPVGPKTVVFVLKNGDELRVSLTAKRNRIEIYSASGGLVVRPNVSNVVTVTTEDRD